MQISGWDRSPGTGIFSSTVIQKDGAPLPEPLAYPSRKGSQAGPVQEVRGSPLPPQLQPRVWPLGAQGTRA